MIGIDTNVLVRYFAQDDPLQSPVASALLEGLSPERRGYVPIVALVELVWVMTRRFEVKRNGIAAIVQGILESRELVVESPETVRKALQSYATSTADFADCLIERTCHAAACEWVATFDAAAARTPGFRLLAQGMADERA
ncbi:type II toxin-antitoxin system VapC family toxin [Cupriavidus sp. UGS-1]|uniref:PIN domain-containing protein n=1 Tax=Cupriavidus sp. UGS-1 TaxID=2899826 RepID=UPI001E6509B8|nr:type II toxin-antitoxin system VapC family toxin [Cupriavidus sp. UGS-1]